MVLRPSIYLLLLCLLLITPLCIDSAIHERTSEDGSVNLLTDKAAYMSGDTLHYSVTVLKPAGRGKINVSLLSDSFMCSGGCKDIVVTREHELSGAGGQTIKGELMIPPLTPGGISSRYSLEASYERGSVDIPLEINSTYNIEYNGPTEMFLNGSDNFPAGIKISNTGDKTLEDLTICLAEIYDYNVSEPCKAIPALNPDETKELTWDILLAKKDKYGPVELYMRSGMYPVGQEIYAKHIYLLAPPNLWIGEETYVEMSEDDLGRPYNASFLVRNVGDLNATGIDVNISYLPGVNASQKSWRIERLDGGTLVNLSTGIAVNEPSDYVFSIIAQDDAGNNASGMIFARVTPTLNATLEDGFADWIGDEKFRQTIPPYERGDYSVLVVNASIYVSRPGAGYAYGTLYKNGEEVTESIWPNDVIFTPFNSTGLYNLTVSFPSPEIYRMKADGPYTIMVTLWNKDKDRLDRRNYTTSAYNHTDFFTSIPPRPEDTGNEKLKNG